MTIISTVYRVNFLRPKARYDRWDEELKTVRHEMGWSIRYFDHHRTQWMVRAQKVGNTEGQRAYAYKQTEMWDKFVGWGNNSLVVESCDFANVMLLCSFNVRGQDRCEGDLIGDP